MTQCSICKKENTPLAEGMCIDCLKTQRPDVATVMLGIMREEERLRDEANRKYFNPALWEKEQLVKIIERYHFCCMKLLASRYRDGECDACALTLFADEVQEIDEALMKLREEGL